MKLTTTFEELLQKNDRITYYILQIIKLIIINVLVFIVYIVYYIQYIVNYIPLDFE